MKGLDQRLEVILAEAGDQVESLRQAYRDRLDFELDTIIQMGFPDALLPGLGESCNRA